MCCALENLRGQIPAPRSLPFEIQFQSHDEGWANRGRMYLSVTCPSCSRIRGPRSWAGLGIRLAHAEHWQTPRGPISQHLHHQHQMPAAAAQVGQPSNCSTLPICSPFMNGKWGKEAASLPLPPHRRTPTTSLSSPDPFWLGTGRGATEGTVEALRERQPLLMMH